MQKPLPMMQAAKSNLEKSSFHRGEHHDIEDCRRGGFFLKTK
jgi:hypothetical protein